MANINNIKVAFDIALRIPPLFILDNASKTSLISTLTYCNEFVNVLFQHSFTIFCSIIAVSLFYLPNRQLISVYKVIGTGLIACFSFYCNDYYARSVITNPNGLEGLAWKDWTFLTIENINFQVILTFAYIATLQDQEKPGHTASTLLWRRLRASCLYTACLCPVVLSALGLHSDVVKLAPFGSFLVFMIDFHIFLLRKVIPVASWLFNAYRSGRRFVRHFGIEHFLENEWKRLRVPTVLRTFWILRFLCYCVLIFYEFWYKNSPTKSPHSMTVEYNLYERFSPLNYEHLLRNRHSHNVQNITVAVQEHKSVTNFIGVLISKSLTIGCDSFISLMGMTSVLASIAHYIGLGLSWFIQSDNEDDRSIGTMTALLFFILAMQTGLTGMHPEERYIRLGRNMFLLTTAILHFVHAMVNPVLLNLSASQHHLPYKHVRPLVMSLFLVIFPVTLLVRLWSQYSLSTWLLAVTAFSVEVVIKVVLSLLIYALFMIDAYRTSFWEGLDDCIYYIKAVGNCVEFTFAIFLFFNGAWILIFESGGTIRAIMMCIHAYFNIWVQAKEGWKTFIRRRNAVGKINSLPTATAEDLRLLNDVCAICYQELQSAVITACRHYFHGVCLRKWLYLQDVCPLCHSTVYELTGMKESNPADQRQD